MAKADAHTIADSLSNDGRFLQRWNQVWLALILILVTVTATISLLQEPAYLHDWRFLAIIALSLALVALYMFGTSQTKCWPIPLRVSIPVWGATYLTCILLMCIDAGFTSDLYVAFGLAFVFFQSARLIPCISLLFLSFCISYGLFTWPLSWSNVGGIFGLAISLYSFIAIAWLMQRLFGERFTRNRLLRELAEAHAALETAHQQLAESALQERELAVLRERTRLAREMHDTLGHALVLVSVKLEAAQRLRKHDAERCDRELEQTKEIVRASMTELRASIANLRSSAQEHESISGVLNRYAYEIAQRTGWHVHAIEETDCIELPIQIKDALLRIGQEALINVEKHAHAHTISLSLQKQANSITLRIEDDGVGLPISLYHERISSPPGHYGLSGMVERAESLDGALSLRSGQPGTIVEATIPLVATEMEQARSA